MLDKFRERRDEESGFTLVELLVVMLILGILAAIAVPAFFSQRDKARDADAKAAVRTSQTAIEAFATDNGGDYTGALPADLIAIEPTLTGKTIAVTAAAATYTLTVDSVVTGQSFTIQRLDSGASDFECTVHGDAGCPTDGNWGT